MIQLKNILLVQSIARAVKEDGCFVTPNVGAIIAGLNSESFCGFQYDETTLVKTLPIVTKEDTNHTEMIEHAAEVIAANMRERFENIRNIISPLVNRIEERCREELATSAPIDNMMQSLYLRLQCVDDIPFDSKYVPTQPAREIDFRKQDIKKYLSGTYLYLEDEQAIALMNTTDEDINKLFAENCREIRCLFNSVFNEKSNDVFGELSPSHFTAYYGLWLLLNKLIRADEPIPQATKVTLDDYKADLSYIRDLAQGWLVEARSKLMFYSKGKVVISRNQAKLNTTNTVPTISGEVEVWYTNDAIDEIMRADTTLTEVIYGYLIGSLTKRIPTGFDPIMAKEYTKVYHEVNNDMASAHTFAFSNQYVKIVASEIERYVSTNPTLVGIVNEKYKKRDYTSECPEYMRVTKLLAPELESLATKLSAFAKDKDFNSRSILMSSDLLLVFMDLIGLDKSAALIRRTTQSVVCGDGDTAAKVRENNTNVVIKTIVSELLRGM